MKYSVINNYVDVETKEDCSCGFCLGLMITARPGCPKCKHTLSLTVTHIHNENYTTICPYCEELIELTDGMYGIV